MQTRRDRRWSGWCAVVLGLVLVGCGGEGGEPDSPAPSATPPPALATETPQPTPTATATPDPEVDEVVVGVGHEYGRPLPNGGRAVTSIVIRQAGDGWERIPLTILDDGAVFGVTFASATDVWAFGGRGGLGTHGVLVRSRDAGRTWVDVSRTLPADCPQIFDAVFTDAATGYVVGRLFISFPFPVVFGTNDGGETWHAVAIPGQVEIFGIYALGARSGAVELVHRDGHALVAARLDDGTLPPVVVSGGGSIGGLNAFSTVGPAGWIADMEGTAIYRSAAPGAPWRTQPLALDLPATVQAIDVRDAGHGVAGGFASSLTRFVPLLLVSDDVAAAWRPAAIAEVPDGWAIRDVLRLRDDGGVAIASEITGLAVGSLVLRSEDGGQSWQREPNPFEHDVQMFDLARNTERP